MNIVFRSRPLVSFPSLALLAEGSFPFFTICPKTGSGDPHQLSLPRAPLKIWGKHERGIRRGQRRDARRVHQRGQRWIKASTHAAELTTGRHVVFDRPREHDAGSVDADSEQRRLGEIGPRYSWRLRRGSEQDADDVRGAEPGVSESAVAVTSHQQRHICVGEQQGQLARVLQRVLPAAPVADLQL